MKYLLVAGVFLSLLRPTHTVGEPITYNVRFEGRSIENNRVVRAFGTLELDLDLPFREAVLSSELVVQRQGGATIPLQSLPGGSAADPGDALEWQAVGDELYVNRISSLNRSVQWSSATNQPFASLFFSGGEPNNVHGIFYRAGGEDDTIVLKPSSGPDGPQGFFVGRIVPEPSCGLVVAVAGVVIAVRRSRGACNG